MTARGLEHLSSEIATAARGHFVSAMDQAPPPERLLKAAVFMVVTEIAAPKPRNFYAATATWRNYAGSQYERATGVACPWQSLDDRRWRGMSRFSASYFQGAKDYAPTDEQIILDLLAGSPDLRWTHS